MANLFKTFWQRVVIDYKEWFSDWQNKWAIKREIKQIDSAIIRARARHERDHKTYYIIRDKRGAVNALNSSEINYWTRRGMFPRMTVMQRLEKSIDIISNNHVYNQYFKEVKQSNPKPNE